MSGTLIYNASQITTAAGHTVQISLRYTAGQKAGVSVLTAAAGVSLLSVVYLLIVLAISAYKTIRMPSEDRFIRTHVVVYFICLLISDAIAGVGSLMSSYWVGQGGVFLGTFCTGQGALKNAGNVGTALWTMVIAIHTFCLIILKWRSRDLVLYMTIFVVWAFIGSVVLVGPAAVESLAAKGPYFGVSGYWCWITDAYSVQHVTLEYFWMFLAASVSCVLYTVTFLNLRGNLVVSGGKLRLRVRRTIAIWDGQTGRDLPDGKAMSLAKQMLVYPVAYTALILPIAICRFLEWSGTNVPFELTLFADTVFVLSGLVNAVLFTTTRKLVPGRPWLTPSSSRSQSRGLGSRFAFDVESQRSFVPFVTEKVSVSPIDAPAEKQQQQEQHQQKVMVVAVPLPVHYVKGKLSPGAESLSEVSVYSQDGPLDAPILSVPRPKLRSPVAAAAAVVFKQTLGSVRRKTPLDVPESVPVGGVLGERRALPPIQRRALPPVPPAAGISHSKSASSTSSTGRRAPGTRF